MTVPDDASQCSPFLSVIRVLAAEDGCGKISSIASTIIYDCHVLKSQTCLTRASDDWNTDCPDRTVLRYCVGRDELLSLSIQLLLLR
jgi:hypothetical protein